MATSIPVVNDLVSVHAAARWLRERGKRPNTRQSIYIALARGRLRAFAIVDKVTLIKRSELERYAKTLNREECRTATSA